MTQVFAIHPTNPQPRLIKEAVNILHKNGVIVYPTDSAYALGCQLESKEAAARIREIRQLSQKHNFTLVCKDLSAIATYAYVSNSVFRLLKAYTPGPYTFILPATSVLPKRLQHPKLKTIGLRIPENKITHALLELLDAPIMSVSLIMPGEEQALDDPEEIYKSLKGKIDLLIDGGFCGIEPTSVIDLTSGVPEIIRKGKGATDGFE